MLRPPSPIPRRFIGLAVLATLALSGCRGSVFDPVTTVERTVRTDGVEFDLAIRGPLGWIEPLEPTDILGLDLDYFVIRGETWRRLPRAGWRIERGVTATAPVIVRREPLQELLATGGITPLAVVERSSGQVTAHLVVGRLTVESSDVLREAISGTASSDAAPEREKITAVAVRTPVSAAEFDARGSENAVARRQVDVFGCDGIASLVDGNPIRLHTARWDYAPLDSGVAVSCSEGKVILLSTEVDEVVLTVLDGDGKLLAHREISIPGDDAVFDALHRPQRATIAAGVLAFDAYQTRYGDAEQHVRTRVTVPFEPDPAPPAG